MHISHNKKTDYQFYAKNISSLLSATDEASVVQHLPCDHFRGYGTLNYFQNGKFHEETFLIAEMPLVIENFMRNGGAARDAYISQHSYKRPSRRIDSLYTLNLCSVDIDAYNTKAGELNETALINLVLAKCKRHSIAEPSYILHSGRGLQVKWILSQPLDGRAITRWQAVQRYLVENIFHDIGADIKATLPTQILRLVGTTNNKDQQKRVIRVIWVNQTAGNIVKVVFDGFASSVLDYSREEVMLFKQKLRQYDNWRAQNNENRKRAAANGFKTRMESESYYRALSNDLKIDIKPTALASIDDTIAGEIWFRRLDLMARIIEKRGGIVQEGEGRHEFAWIAANALGWCNRNNTAELKLDVIEWCQRRIPSYTTDEIVGAASAVLKRSAKSAGLDCFLYRLSETKFRERLALTESELTALSNRTPTRSGKNINDGAMGLERMAGLTFDQYVAETRLRQSKSAKYTNAKKREARRDLKKRAKRMLKNSRSVSYIASRLNISQASVRNYIAN